MNDRQTLLRMASRLRPLAVKGYAESRSWHAVDGVTGRLWVFSHEEHPLRQLIVPMDTDSSSYAEAMLDVAKRVSDIEDRPISSILADLMHPDADIIRFISETPDSAAGDISLAEDLELREGARRLLLSAGCTVLNPVRHHPRMSRTEAEQFVDNCRSGQTEQGSYVILIICPLFQVGEQLHTAYPTPFARATTTILLTATAGLVSAIEADRIDDFLERDMASPTISSNLCGALLKMRPSTPDGRIEIRATWAATTDYPPPDAPARVVIPQDYFPDIERVYRHLYPVAEGETESTFIGTVESLNGPVGDDGRRAGEIILSLLDNDGEQVKARANLNEDWYDIAVEAHHAGIGYVSVQGILRRGVRIGRLDSVVSFRRVQLTI